MRFTKCFIGLIFLLAIGLQGCKKWDDHTSITNPSLNENLLEQINKRPNLSKFSEYLGKTGYDKVISSSKTYTVWAPVNDALLTLDVTIVNDTAKLKQFVANHISNQLFYTGMATSLMRVPLLNGKKANFLNKKFEESAITEADFTVNNGVLHVIDKAVLPMLNAWEFVNSTTAVYKQNTFIVSQNFNGFDPTTAIIDSIRASTGEPVYRPGTGIVARNRFNDQVLNLKNEEKLYTYILLNDAAWNLEITKLNPFFKTGTADSTYNLSAWSLVKDVAVEGLYSIDQLPDTITTASGVRIPINKSAIVETRKLSNGIAYVMNKVDFKKEDKIRPIILEGERPDSFMLDRRTTTYYRVRLNPVNKQVFNDIVVNNHGVANYFIRYRARDVYTAKYNVYIRAINDFQTTSFVQRLGVNTSANFPYANITLLPLTTVPDNSTDVYKELLLGEYTMNAYGLLDFYLTAANSTVNGVNSLSLDYIKLVPVIQ